MEALKIIPASDRDLRRELADAIANASAADAQVRTAKSTLSRAEDKLQAAIGHARSIKGDMDRATAAATERAAQAILEALRAGREPPPVLLPEQPENPALAQALAARNATQLAVLELELELKKACEAAAHARNHVTGIVDAIIEIEARALAKQAMEAIETHWRLLDLVSGLLVSDNARMDGPRLRAFQDEIWRETNPGPDHDLRQYRAARTNRLLLEDHNWRGYLDKMAGIERQRWDDYMSRLSHDATATFEESSK